MSTCPNCGSKFKSGKFRCPNCGSLLIYEPTGKGPSFWYKLKRYKNILILIGLAVVIAAIKAARVFTTYVYLLLIAAAVVIAVMLWLRNRRPRGSRQPNRFQQNRFKQNRIRVRPADPRSNLQKHANVIPFRRKKPDSKPKAKQD